MRSAGKKFFILFLILAAVATGWFCLGRREEETVYPMTRVSVILPHDCDEYWSFIKAGIEENAEKAKDCNIDIKMLKPQLNYNVSQMTEILRKQIAAKVDFIVVQGNGDPEFNEVLLEAWEQGIHIICMDTDIENFPEHLYIGTDNYAAGRLLGEKLVELTGGQADVAVISGEEQYQNMKERYQGFQDAVEQYPEIQIGEVQYDHYDGLTVMQLFYSMSDGADVLVCLEGTGGSTIASVYKGDHTEYEYLIGFDAFEGVRKGILDGVIKQNTSQMGYCIVEEIVRYVTEGSYSADKIFTDISMLTEENYEEVMNEQ